MRVDEMRPILLVSNFDECFRFYRDTLGFKVAFGKEGESYATLVANGGRRLSLFERGKMAEAIGGTNLFESASSDRFSLAFDVDDLEATMDVLREKGVHFITPLLVRRDWGIRTVFLRDPDGNLIELEEGIPMSEWTEELRAEVESYKSGDE
jgi:lactoylglutathione lyase